MPKKRSRMVEDEEDVEASEPEPEVDIVEEAAPVEADLNDLVVRVYGTVAEVAACPRCGLPRAEMGPTYDRLKLSLQAVNPRTKCPRCLEPVDPY